MRLIKLHLALAGAAALFAVSTSTAFAGRLSLSSQTFRSTFSRLDFAGGLGTVECDVTLEGSLHERTIAKVEGNLIGYITSAIVANRCRRGSATILRESLPWHIRYLGFFGTLPNISSFESTIVRVEYQIKEPVFLITCLAAFGRLVSLFSRAAGGALTSMTFNGRLSTDCGAEGTFSGRSSSFTVLNSLTMITVTLI